MQQTPSLGRQVRFYRQDGEELTATITHVWSDTCVNLCVFSRDGGTFGVTSVLLSTGPDDLATRWAWPNPRPQACAMPWIRLGVTSGEDPHHQAQPSRCCCGSAMSARPVAFVRKRHRRP